MESTYAPPAIEDRMPISAPLNTLTNSEPPPQTRTPTWRRTTDR